MGKKASISFVQGKGSLNHNNREFVTENVDKDKIGDNITYKRESLEEAYLRIFGDAIEAYNAKQTRADRRIDGVKGYMNKLKNSGNGEKLFYENVVQVGNMFDSHVGTPQGEVCKEILDEYMKDFQKRNPNLYVFNAVLHMDEQTPHLHIDYIPVAHGYKNGLQARNSLDKALKEQGIGGKANKFENSTLAWQNREKDQIEKIMREHGLERSEDKGLEQKHLTVDQYKAVSERVHNEVRQMPKQIETAPYALNKTRVSVDKNDLERLEKRAKLSLVHEKATKELVAEVKEVKQTLEADKKSAISKYEGMARAHQEEMERYLQLSREQAELNTAYRNLQQRFSDQADEVKRLTEENTSLKLEIADLKRSFGERIEELKEKVKGVVETTLAVTKAVSWLKEKVTDNVALKVCAAIENYSADWLEKDGFPELAEQVGTSGLSKGIRNWIEPEKPKKEKYPERLTFKGGQQGLGFYDKQGGYWGDKSKLAEIKASGTVIHDPYEKLHKNL